MDQLQRLLSCHFVIGSSPSTSTAGKTLFFQRAISAAKAEAGSDSLSCILDSLGSQALSVSPATEGDTYPFFLMSAVVGARVYHKCTGAN